MKFKLRENFNSINLIEGFKEVHVNADGTLADSEGLPIALDPNPDFGSSFGNFSDLNDDDIIDLSKYNPANEIHRGWADKLSQAEHDAYEGQDRGEAGTSGADTNVEATGGQGEGEGADSKQGDNKGGGKGKGKGKGKGGGKGEGENIFKLIIETTKDILSALTGQALTGKFSQDSTDTANGKDVIQAATTIMGTVSAAERGAVDDNTLDDVWTLNKELQSKINIFINSLEPKVLGNPINVQEYTKLVDDIDFIKELNTELDPVVISIQEKIFDYFPNKCYTYVDDNTGDEYIKFGDNIFYNLEDYYEMRDE